MEHAFVISIIACVVGLWMTWGIGANDLANIMSTTIGSKAVTVRQAICIAIVFEFAGGFLGGNPVSHTMQSGIINLEQLKSAPDLLVYGMLSVILASSTWITFASYLGMPVSITNAVVGGLVGMGALTLGMHAIHWHKVSYIALSWLGAPLVAGTSSFILFTSIRRWILAVPDPFFAAKRHIFIYLILIGIILSFMTTFKAYAHFGIHLKVVDSLIALFGTTLIVVLLGLRFIEKIMVMSGTYYTAPFEYIEKMFSVLMAFTACAMVFAHGSNDVAIATGPIIAIINMAYSSHGTTFLSNAVILMGCAGAVAGLLMFGRKVIATVGNNITALTPSRAFAATFSAAITVIVLTSTGIPVSTTQTLVGGVLGVGLARGIGALNLAVMRNIFMSWIITVPASAALATAFFYMIQNIVK